MGALRRQADRSNGSLGLIPASAARLGSRRMNVAVLIEAAILSAGQIMSSQQMVAADTYRQGCLKRSIATTEI